MNVLITGISGLLGNALAQELSKNYQISGIYYQDKDLIEDNNKSFDLFECDISDKNQLFKKIKDLNIKPDVIIHTVALTNLELCQKEQEKCWKVNVLGTRNIAEVAKKTGSKFIYISTVSIFSGEKGNYKENDIPCPENFYNLTKLLGEEITLSLEKGLILRTNLIGIHPKRNQPANFLEWLVKEIKNNKNLTLFKDVRVNPLSNFTLAEIISRILIKKPKEKIIHLGTKNILSKAEIATLVIKKFPEYKGKAKIISVDDLDFSTKRGKEMWLCPDFAENKLDLKMPFLEKEIDKAVGPFFAKSQLKKYE